MTPEEHELMMLLLARVYEYFELITETLKSRGLWTEDDEKAFAHMVHDDPAKLLRAASRARKDYLALLRESGVDPGKIKL